MRNFIASHNGSWGLEAVSGGVIRVGHSVVSGNRWGVQAFTGGTIFSYGDNNIDGNTNNIWSDLTPLAMH